MGAKKAIITTALLLAGLSATLAQNQARGYAVQTNVTIQNNPLSFDIYIYPHYGNVSTDSVKIYRRSSFNSNWGAPVDEAITNLSSGYTFNDDNVVEGATYEYKVEKYFGAEVAYGYLYVGSKVSAVENRGKLIFLIDSALVSSMATELLLMERDMIGDGWQVVRVYAQSTDDVTVVKSKIKSTYNLDKTNTKALLIFGNIAVPYSGVFDDKNGNPPPDGHSPDHEGAWATDLYYGDMDDNLWTDDKVKTDGKITRDENKNKKSDGKFDQMVLPSELELQVARVDLSDLSSFSKNELGLLKNYVNKAHSYRHGVTSVDKEGIIDDHFGPFNGEAFAADGWGNFSRMYPFSDVYAQDFKLANVLGNPQWAYACGAGTYTSALGVTNILEITGISYNKAAVFNAVLGSYFGDWDNSDNLLRSFIATDDLGLVSFWSGRPHWLMHTMALGATIGDMALLSQNKDDSYDKGNYDNMIQMNVMGDLTLRQDVVKPVSNISLARVNNNADVKITWSASQDQVAGYYVYRADNYGAQFVRITSTLITDTTFIDTAASSQGAVYMVRAMKLETTASGSYYNLSQGIFAEDVQNQNANILNVETFENTIIMSVYPNPTTDGKINITFSSPGEWDVYVTDVAGKMVTSVSHISSNTTSFNLSDMAKGLYFVKAQQGNEQFVKKVVVQ